MSRDDIVLEAEMSMEKSVDYMTHEFAAVRTGKASPGLVENVDVHAYGSTMKLKQLALITTPESRLLVVQPFDAGTVQDIERALDESKKLKTAGGLTEDGFSDVEEEVQQLTDGFVKSVDDHLKHKEAEILKV